MTPATGSADEGHGKKSIGGVLYKWTNYVSGWQPRYFEISNGSLSYYKSKAEQTAGCRGSISLKSARIELTDDFSKCEFSVRVNDDIVWYLKADSPLYRERWHRRLTADAMGLFSNLRKRSIQRRMNEKDSDYSSKGHSRTPSVASSTMSSGQTLHSPSGDGQREALISERLLELGAYRELCAAQMAEIEKELEALSSSSSAPPISRAKLLTLKATHIAMLSNVDRILQLTAEQTEMVQVHARPPAGLAATAAAAAGTKEENGAPATSPTFTTAPLPSPAHSNGLMSDDDECWHDADEESDERLAAGRSEEKEDSPPAAASPPAQLQQLQQSQQSQQSRGSQESNDDEEKENHQQTVDRHLPFGCFDRVAFSDDHSLAEEVRKLTESQLDYALNGADDTAMWTLFASDGEMKMYKREIEQDGLPVDPLKALHSVKGVSALEFTHYFFDAQYKMGWDHTLEGMRVVERISADLVVMHQKHKTVWPAAPRESLFWSHIRRVDDRKSEGAHDCYVVCNKDVQRKDVPLGSSSAVRVGLTVSMICETFVDNPNDLPLTQLPRSAFTCKVIYVSSVHPGGWVPTSALRHVYKREYPKFLRTFTTFVHEKVKKSPAVAI